MVRAGQLRQRIDIEQSTQTADASGQLTDSWLVCVSVQRVCLTYQQARLLAALKSNQQQQRW